MERYTRLPRALLVSIAAIAIIESAAWRAPRALWSGFFAVSEIRDDEAFRFRSRVERISVDRPALLLMGSSQIREGADTDQIQRILFDAGLGRIQVVNLGTSAGAFLELYGQLDLALRKRPAIIVASPGPHGLYWPYSELDSLTEYCYSLETAGSLIWSLRGSVGINALQRFLGVAFLYEMLPSSRLVRSYKIHTLGARWIGNHQPKSPEYYYSRDLTLTEMEESFQSLPPPRISGRTSTQSGLARATIKKILDDGSAICFLDFPLNPAAGDLTAAWEPSIRGSEEILNELAENHQFRYRKRDSLPQFDAGDFRDVCHLNQRGRSKMSEVIAEMVIQELRSRNDALQKSTGKTEVPAP